VLDQMVRELPDREDVDEVEEQLQRGDDALRAGRPRDAIRIAAILSPALPRLFSPDGHNHRRRGRRSLLGAWRCHRRAFGLVLWGVSRSERKLERKGRHMSVHMAEGKIRAESVTDVQAAAQKMFAAISAAQPEGIRYAWCVLPDGETFVALVQVDDGVENPIPGLPEFREIQEGLEDWLAEPPNTQPLTVIGSYRLF
jgi:hypothetical protein